MNDALISVSMHKWKMVLIIWKAYLVLSKWQNLMRLSKISLADLKVGGVSRGGKPLEPGDSSGNIPVSYVASGDAKEGDLGLRKHC